MIDDVTLKEQFKKATRGLHHHPKAIFPSELFLFYREAKRIEADHIIESGIGYGGSTSYLDRLFPDIKITSIDRGEVEDVRALHPRIEFIQGDGRHEVSRAVWRSEGKNIAVLIDGPKGWIATMMTNSLLLKDNVKIVAIHDLQSDKESKFYLQREVMRDRIIRFLNKAYVNSHDQKFREFASDLDRGVAALKKYPNGPGLSIYRC